MNTCRTLNYLLKNRNNRGVYSLQLKHTSNRGGILYGLSFNVKPIRQQIIRHKLGFVPVTCIKYASHPHIYGIHVSMASHINCEITISHVLVLNCCGLYNDVLCIISCDFYIKPIILAAHKMCSIVPFHSLSYKYMTYIYNSKMLNKYIFKKMCVLD